MRIAVTFIDAARTRAVVQRCPSWLGRLFGRKVMATEVVFDANAVYDWRYAVDNMSVDRNLGQLLHEWRHWQPVERLPAARLTRKA